MSASGGATTLRRLRILDDEELEALYGRPCFSAEERAEYYTLTPVEQELLRVVRGLSSQVAWRPRRS